MNLLVMFFSIFMSSCLTLNLFEDRNPSLTEYTVKGSGINKIALINISGSIENKSKKDMFTNSPGKVQSLVSQLRLAANDPLVRAVFIKLDSPGGSVTASDIMYHEIQRFKKLTNKRVVVMGMDRILSGGYYMALAADRIYTHPTTMVGSVGVVFMSPKVYGLLDKVGVDYQVYKSGRNKDIGSPFRKATKEEDEVFQNMIDSSAKRFWSLVKTNRKISEDNMKLVKTARIFDPQDAKTMGLIDGVMYLDEAIAKTAKEKASQQTIA